MPTWEDLAPLGPLPGLALADTVLRLHIMQHEDKLACYKAFENVLTNNHIYTF